MPNDRYGRILDPGCEGGVVQLNVVVADSWDGTLSKEGLVCYVLESTCEL